MAVLAAVETITRQAARVGSPHLSAETPAAELPFGYSGSYWLDLRGYDPVALDKPMLIPQGGRDYQVSVAGDLADRQAGLAHRTDVTLRVYDADDHLFFPCPLACGSALHRPFLSYLVRPRWTRPATVTVSGSPGG
ncbi:hypothetical protein GCM10023259_040770 [Thermocatellispora tengchongensis]